MGKNKPKIIKITWGGGEERVKRSGETEIGVRLYIRGHSDSAFTLSLMESFSRAVTWSDLCHKRMPLAAGWRIAGKGQRWRQGDPLEVRCLIWALF